MARLVVQANQDGTIVSLEGNIKEILGWEVGDLLGKSVEELIPYKYRERHRAGLQRWVKTKQKSAMGSWIEVQARRSDGNVIPVTFCVTERKGVLEAILETPSDPELPNLDN